MGIEQIRYSPESGEFLRRMPPSRRHPSGFLQKAGSITDKGYVSIGIDGKYYKAHRVAWFLMTGKWPRHQVDHIDGNKSNNTWANLREATNAQNQYNTNAKRYNKIGLKGAHYYSRGKKNWSSRIAANGTKIFLGYFATAEEAHAAYKQAAVNLHGEYARKT